MKYLITIYLLHPLCEFKLEDLGEKYEKLLKLKLFTQFKRLNFDSIQVQYYKSIKVHYRFLNFYLELLRIYLRLTLQEVEFVAVK